MTTRWSRAYVGLAATRNDGPRGADYGRGRRTGTFPRKWQSRPRARRQQRARFKAREGVQVRRRAGTFTRGGARELLPAEAMTGAGGGDSGRAARGGAGANRTRVQGSRRASSRGRGWRAQERATRMQATGRAGCHAGASGGIASGGGIAGVATRRGVQTPERVDSSLGSRRRVRASRAPVGGSRRRGRASRGDANDGLAGGGWAWCGLEVGWMAMTGRAGGGQRWRVRGNGNDGALAKWTAPRASGTLAARGSREFRSLNGPSRANGPRGLAPSGEQYCRARGGKMQNRKVI